MDQVVGHVMTDPFSDDDQDMGGYVRFSNGIECLVHAKSAARRGIEVMGSRESSLAIIAVFTYGN